MFSACHAALIQTLNSQFALSKSRLVTLSAMIVGLAQSRTVNLTHLAGHLPGDASHASAYRRLQRFFQFVHLDADRLALLVVHMLNLGREIDLALDRTNWKIGSTNINVLVLAIVTRRFRVPLLWSLIPHQGNSNTQQRIALMQRYLALFGASSIKCLFADREFIGARWMDFLNENNIPFVIRVREDMTLVQEDGQAWMLRSLLRRKRARKTAAILQGRLNGVHGTTERPIQIAAKRLNSMEWLVVATNQAQVRLAPNLYRKRWGIECLFADTKTRGFNLEDTRLRDAAKLDTLLILVTLAITWAYRCATCKMGMKVIARKIHGRREKSWFRIGFDVLRRWLNNDQHKAISAWVTQAPKRACSPMVKK